MPSWSEHEKKPLPRDSGSRSATLYHPNLTASRGCTPSSPASPPPTSRCGSIHHPPSSPGLRPPPPPCYSWCGRMRQGGRGLGEQRRCPGRPGSAAGPVRPLRQPGQRRGVPSRPLPHPNSPHTSRQRRLSRPASRAGSAPLPPALPALGPGAAANDAHTNHTGCALFYLHRGFPFPGTGP